jgi:hypothetical protein
VQHLLHGDAAQRLAPAVGRFGLLASQPLAGTVFETEFREHVLAHDHVLELGGLGERPPQVLAVRDDDPGFSHGAPILSFVLQFSLRPPGPRAGGRGDGVHLPGEVVDLLSSLPEVVSVTLGQPG